MTGATPVLARLRSAAARLVSATRSRLPGVTQAAGVASVSAGVFVLAGLGVGLVVTGVLAVGLGVLFEPTSKGR
jgi:hypothetical protein